MISAVYIAGRWHHDGPMAVIRDPSDQREVVAEVALARPDHAVMALDAAAVAQPKWAATPAVTRSARLRVIADLIISRRAELAATITQEEGKGIAEAGGEVDRAAETFVFFASQCLAHAGSVLPPARPGSLTLVERRPVGPIVAITAFNYPLLVPAWKLAAALAYGNTVVWKPSELVPLSAVHLASIVEYADLPSGVFNLVAGDGQVGTALIDHPAVAGVSFTGSTVVGRAIAQRVAGRSMRLQLELGGSNPAVILDDADLAGAVLAVVSGAMGSAGQKCTAVRRLICAEAVYSEILERLLAEVHLWPLGPGLSRAAKIPPLASEAGRRRVLDAVAAARQRGVVIARGGQVPVDVVLEHGLYVEPTVLTDVPVGDPVRSAEIFGPVLVVLRAGNDDEAIAIANETQFGLNAGVFTRDLARALDLGNRLQAGMVHVNAVSGFFPHVPFGGHKDSGSGPLECGADSYEFYTRARVFNIHGSVR